MDRAKIEVVHEILRLERRLRSLRGTFYSKDSVALHAPTDDVLRAYRQTLKELADLFQEDSAQYRELASAIQTAQGHSNASIRQQDIDLVLRTLDESKSSAWKPATATSAPSEPQLEPGPQFSLVSGKLDLVSDADKDDSYDRATQFALHNRIVRQVTILRTETLRAGNSYPGLTRTVDEYTKLVERPIDDLDVVDLWALGNALIAQAISFEKQNAARTLTSPLEPSHLASLIDVARLHGGFILGFAKGVELTRRADHAQMAPGVLGEISDRILKLLNALSQNRRLVSDRVQQFIAPIQDSLLMAGWETARIGYTGYVVVRNALIQLGKALVWTNDKGGSVVGSVVLSSMIASSGMQQEALELSFQFLYTNASDILAFAAPFPELRAWFGWIIDYLAEEQEKRSN